MKTSPSGVDEQFLPYLIEAVDLAQRGELLASLEIFDLISLRGGDFELLYFNRALVLQNLCRWPEALLNYQQVLRRNPNNVDALINRGNVWRALKNPSNAEQDYRLASNIEQNNFSAHFNLGTLLIESGRLKDACDSLRRATNISPGVLDARYRYAGVLKDLGNFELAYREYEGILERDGVNKQAMLQLASLLFQGKRYAEAENFATRALDAGERSPAIFRFLGYCQLHQRKLTSALSSFSSAVELDIDDVDARVRQIYIALELGQTAGVLDLSKKLKPIAEGNSDALRVIGLAHQACGDLEQALEFFDRSLKIDPGNRAAVLNKAGALRMLNRPDAALTYYLELVASSDPELESLIGYGFTLSAVGERWEALTIFKRAISLFPNSPEAHLGEGMMLEALLGDSASLSSYERSVAQAANAPALIRLSMARGRLGFVDQAVVAAEQAVGIDPVTPDALLALGIAYFLRGDYLESIRVYEVAIQALPTYAEVWLNKGVSLQKIGKVHEARACYLKAVELRSDWGQPLYNLGVLLQESNNLPEAIDAYRSAIEKAPDHALAQMNLGMALMTMQRLPEGWRHFEWRLKTPKFLNKSILRPDLPPWTGEDVKGKKVLAISEQGYGDTIQFCRFCLTLISLGAQVTIVPQDRLIRLLKCLPAISVQSAENTINATSFDFCCYLMSIPAFLKNLDVNQIPFGDKSYLHAEATWRSKWLTVIDSSPAFKIGIAWTAGSKSEVKGRNIPLNEFLDILKCNADFYSLQIELSQLDQLKIEQHGLKLCHTGHLQDDFADTAALIEQMDMVITVDTSVAHLAGALGKETWILLPFASDWRWFRGREDSPWYQNARLFRQTSAGDWSQPIKRVKEELSKKLK